MSVPPNVRALRADDFPGAKESGIGALNRFVGGVTAGLTKALTYRENFAGMRLEFEVTIPDDWMPAPLAAGASLPDASRPGLYRVTYDGEVEAIGVVAPSAVPGDLFVLPDTIRPRQLLTFPNVASSALSVVTVSTAGVVRQAAGSAGGTNVQLRFVPVTRAPWTPSCWPKTFQWAPVLQPTGAIVEAAFDQHPGAPQLGAPQVNYTYDSTSRVLSIVNVLGLHPGRTYRLVLFVFA